MLSWIETKFHFQSVFRFLQFLEPEGFKETKRPCVEVVYFLRPQAGESERFRPLDQVQQHVFGDPAPPVFLPADDDGNGILGQCNVPYWQPGRAGVYFDDGALADFHQVLIHPFHRFDIVGTVPVDTSRILQDFHVLIPGQRNLDVCECEGPQPYGIGDLAVWAVGQSWIIFHIGFLVGLAAYCRRIFSSAFPFASSSINLSK